MAQLRDFEGITSKRDYYMIDPRTIVIDPEYNVRDLTTPDAREKLGELKASIKVNGVETPLKIRWHNDKPVLVQGHRRLTAVNELIASGEDIKSVPVMPESKGVGEADRVVDLIVSNTGEPLQPLEKAQVIKRLMVFGWNNDQIATRLAMNIQTVVNLQNLLEIPENIKAMVQQKTLSASAAVAVSKGGAKAVAAVTKAAKAGKKVSAKAVAKAEGDEAALGKKDVRKLIDFVRFACRTDDPDKIEERGTKLLLELGITP